MTYAEAISKAVRLLRLAQSDNANEAASAAAKAQEIIDRYKLGALGLDSTTDPDAPNESLEPVADFSAAPLEDGSIRISEWKIRLASYVAKANQCETYLRMANYSKAISIVGRASDAEVVRYLYAWLVRETDRLTERDGKGLGKSWRNNFRIGVTDTIRRKLEEQRHATEAAVIEEARAQTAIPADRAMVLVKSAIVKLESRATETANWISKNLKLKTVPVGGGRHNPSARQSGREAGEEINLRPARGALGSENA